MHAQVQKVHTFGSAGSRPGKPALDTCMDVFNKPEGEDAESGKAVGHMRRLYIKAREQRTKQNQQQQHPAPLPTTIIKQQVSTAAAVD